MQDNLGNVSIKYTKEPQNNTTKFYNLKYGLLLKLL